MKVFDEGQSLVPNASTFITDEKLYANDIVKKELCSKKKHHRALKRSQIKLEHFEFNIWPEIDSEARGADLQSEHLYCHHHRHLSLNQGGQSLTICKDHKCQYSTGSSSLYCDLPIIINHVKEFFS